MTVPVAERPAQIRLLGRVQASVLRAYPALGNRAFRTFWIGVSPAMIAWQMNVIATGYAAFALTGTATWLGVVSLAIGLPAVLLSLVGGAVADLWPKHQVLMITQTVFALAAAAIAGLSFMGLLEIWHLVALGAVQGVVSAFNMPARQAYIADLAGSRDLRNAVGLNNAAVNFSRIVGPAAAGALIAAPGIGVGGVFAAMAVLYVVVLGTLVRIPSTGAGAGRRPATLGAVGEMLVGIRYIRASAFLPTLMLLALVPIFFGMPYQTLMPVFSERIFEAGPGGLGILMACVGLGALVGTMLTAAFSSIANATLLQVGLGASFGIALVVFAISPTFWMAAAVLLIVGATGSSYNSYNNTLIMANTDPQLYGRVMSVYMLTFSLMPIAALPAAWLADLVGGRFAIGLGGVIVASFILSVAVFYPPYRMIK